MVQGRLGTGPVIGKIPSTWKVFAYPHLDEHRPPVSRRARVIVLCGCGRWNVSERGTWHPGCQYEVPRMLAEEKRMGRTRPCITCGAPSVAGRSRCGRHGARNAARQGPNPYDHAHQKAAKQVLAAADRCAICGLPARAWDPLEADHIIPLSLGGSTGFENLQAAHKSCNVRKGGANRLRHKK